MSGHNQFRSTYTFWLPPELWMRVAYFLPRMPDQPRWQPWVKYRGLNRIFKKEIEDFYFEHWIKRSELWVKCEQELPPDVPGLYDVDLHECYIFSGFRDSEKRIAVFEGQRLKWTDPRDREILILIEKMLNEFDEQGYHPYITFEIEKGVTDLIPIDLRLRHTIRSSYFTFDWRTYLCTLLWELRHVDEYELLSGCKSQPRLAVELRWKTKYGQMKPMEAMLHLVRAAGTELVGRDGRLLEIRRCRRHRLGLKTGKLRPRPLAHDTSVLERRFAQVDEELVSETLLDSAMMSDVQIEW